MTLSSTQNLARAAIAALAALAASCSKAPEVEIATAPQPIRIDGSSTMYPLSLAAAAAYKQAGADQLVEVAESGTTAGLEKFCAGAVDIAGASRPITSREMGACFRGGVHYVEAPVAFDGVTVIVHPSSPVRTATIAQLRAIWTPEAQGSVNTWKAANSSWPDEPLILFGPGANSGAFDYFTEAVMGQARASRTDYSSSEDDNVIVEGVATTPGAMGYLGLAYYERNKSRLRALAIDEGEGPVAPSTASVQSGAYHPLARPIIFYVNLAALDRPEVQQFAEFYVDNAARLAAEVNYVPLPETVYPVFKERIQSRRYGTAFGGRAHAGETIEEVIARPLAEAAS